MWLVKRTRKSDACAYYFCVIIFDRLIFRKKKKSLFIGKWNSSNLVIWAQQFFAQLFVLASLFTQSQSCVTDTVAQVPERQTSCYTDTDCYLTSYPVGVPNSKTKRFGFSLQYSFFAHIKVGKWPRSSRKWFDFWKSLSHKCHWVLFMGLAKLRSFFTFLMECYYYE